MKFVDSPTEKTTAVTNVILAVMGIAAAVYLHGIGQKNCWKSALWIWIFGLTILLGILGSIAHGFKMSKKFQTFLWHPIYFLLYLLIALCIGAVAHDIWGEAVARQTLTIMAVISIGCFGVNIVCLDNFLIFIIYGAVAMSSVMGGYIWLAYQGHIEGAWLMAAGFFVSLVAAGVQAGNSFSFTFIWPFDHNGSSHLILMAGIVLLAAGLSKAPLSQCLAHSH